MSDMIDIHSKSPYPSCALSNFAEHHFIIDGVECASMEGFLQSLKFHAPKKQREICKLYGKQAKKSPGRLRNLYWKITQTLHWNGKRYKRNSVEYTKLIIKAYDALAINKEYREALTSTGSRKLCHSIGNDDKRKTVLTEQEFIEQLYRIREMKQN